jgi:tetratricopeptide (TPR) repeat protein
MMDRQHARERATEYQIAPIIEQHFRDEQLFLTPFHPTLRISRYIALTFLATIGAPSGAIERVTRLMTDSFYFKFALPVHPSVAVHFGLKWADERTLYRLHEDGYVTFSEFVDRYLLCKANSPLHEAMHALERGEPDAAERIEKALPATPSSPWGLNALAKARLLQGRHEEALSLLRLALEIDPELEWGHFHLAKALDELGDPDGAEAAFRAEIRLRPFRHGVYNAVAHFLFSRGDLVGAADMMRRALELEPRSAAYDQLLARLNVPVLTEGENSQASPKPGSALRDCDGRR